MLRVVTYFLFLVALSSACWAQINATPAASTSARKGLTRIIDRMPGAAPSALPSAAPSANNGIQYNGGPIMDDANGVNVYFIWYGDWSKDTDAQRILVNFITHIGGSAYFNINTTYYSLEPGPNSTKLTKDRVINAVHYMGSTTDNYSQGANLSDNMAYAAAANAITSGALPLDKNGVYFLLTSGDVNQSDVSGGFGTTYCGWHASSINPELPTDNWPLVDGIDIKVAWVGNAATQYAYNCIWNYQTTMSGSLAADGMANTIAHELAESVTDPDTTSWYLNSGFGGENGDLCNFVFPGPYHSGSASDPQPPDIKFGGIPYLIQEIWVNAEGGYCGLKWDE
jgi:Phosphate-induced protein 1 conserved region